MNTIAFRFRGQDLLVPPELSDAQAAFGFDPEKSPAPAGSRRYSVPLPDGGSCIELLIDDPAAEPPALWRVAGARALLAAAAEQAASAGGSDDYSRLLRACHIARWIDESAFCGRCGTRNGFADDEFARHCPSCGKREYPRISPAVIVLVSDGADRILLARNAKFRNGVHSLLAGFVEAGENLEEAARREVLEEGGVAIRDIRYAASQPWPFPDSLMLGFTAIHSEGDIRPDLVEIMEAAWYSWDALPEIPNRGSVARALIDAWVDSRRLCQNDLRHPPKAERSAP